MYIPTVQHASSLQSLGVRRGHASRRVDLPAVGQSSPLEWHLVNTRPLSFVLCSLHSRAASLPTHLSNRKHGRDRTRVRRCRPGHWPDRVCAFRRPLRQGQEGIVYTKEAYKKKFYCTNKGCRFCTSIETTIMAESPHPSTSSPSSRGTVTTSKAPSRGRSTAASTTGTSTSSRSS
jgi:hypothetical protein